MQFPSAINLFFSGRVRRSVYAIRLAIYMLAVFVFAGALVMALVAYNSVSPGSIVKNFKPYEPSVPTVAIWIFVAGFAVLSTQLTVRRVHDMNLSGWWFLAWIVFSTAADFVVPENSPLSFVLDGFALLTSLALFFWPGTKGTNRFGADPRVRIAAVPHME